ncbi:MAG TPA: hypothetical protein VKB86_06635 [Pyrinomonadaceae bacterium]|nr:hypothetical protein [Pyrinomonadaceae bacterium]
MKIRELKRALQLSCRKAAAYSLHAAAASSYSSPRILASDSRRALHFDVRPKEVPLHSSNIFV